MNKYFAYIRVSTLRQGEQGVSLDQQRDAIVNHAQRSRLEISRWFEERETAAHAGRPLFGQMIRQLKARQADGVIIHKIDRSARNLKDWSELGELIDRGIEVHFAAEGLDLNSRGGRLSADIQAVVAADFIRNLREETKKGFYGRLKQGLLPMPAPLGYLNTGAGKPKTVDPTSGPLIRQLYEVYATGRYNFHDLLKLTRDWGLRGRSGKHITKNGLTKLLRNPFYIGLIHIGITGQTFPGAHTPIIPKALYDRVQSILTGKTNTRSIRHDFLFRRRLICKICRYTLIGETHKGFVYYRCQRRDCPITSIREEAAESAMLSTFLQLQFHPDERRYCEKLLNQLRARNSQEMEMAVAALRLRLSQIDDRLNRLTDAYIDRLINKDLFEQRKSALLMERASLEESKAGWEAGKRNAAEELTQVLERANTAYLAYKHAELPEKREWVDIVTSNRLFDGKSLEIMLNSPFHLIANRFTSQDGSPRRDIDRTWKHLFACFAQIRRQPGEVAVEIARKTTPRRFAQR
ncbi:MAG: recombinase family protein [Bryobacteraceae bacterium]|nr:recombinase family protein [Bryobacteraceae bacterium]